MYDDPELKVECSKNLFTFKVIMLCYILTFKTHIWTFDGLTHWKAIDNIFSGVK